MQLNAMFPTRDIGSDPARIRDWAQAAEDLGFATIEVPDHVLGAAARVASRPVRGYTSRGQPRTNPRAASRVRALRAGRRKGGGARSAGPSDLEIP